ncbi:IclR family transcriptional regulator [Aneurinibacillus sp. BA2021]|nr:IclR family transcriptional regulator [Aneurinibacillus sp. BA2021]
MDNYLSSVKNGCRLLKIFLNSPKELGVTDLSKRLQLSKGAVHKLLITLESEGLIQQNPENKLYSLGYTLLELGNQVLKNHNLAELTRPYLQELARNTKELVCLCILDGKDAIYVDKIDSQHPIRFNVDVYRRFPLYATSAARSILAYQSEEFIREILSRGIHSYTSQTITDPLHMRKRLEDIRERGYEISSNMRNEGVTGIAAPIFDASARVIASISLMAPTDRMNTIKEQAIDHVIHTTKAISHKLGYSDT